VEADTRDDRMLSEMPALPGDKRANITADVRRPNGRVVPVRFLMFRNADLGDLIARPEVGECLRTVAETHGLSGTNGRWHVRCRSGFCSLR
jgi:hypothetical protein